MVLDSRNPFYEIRYIPSLKQQCKALRFLGVYSLAQREFLVNSSEYKLLIYFLCIVSLF